MAPVTLRFGVTPVTTTVTELEDVVRVGDPTVGAATGILIGSGVALGSTERLLGSTSEIRVTVTVPATVPGLNCELFPPSQTGVVLPAAIVNPRVLLSAELHAESFVPLAYTTS